MKKINIGKVGAFALLSFSLAACQKDVSSPVEMAPELASTSTSKKISDEVSGITFYALAGNTLDKYSTSNPENVLNSATITGLQMGERILAIDFRPKTGELYGLGSNSRVYKINPNTGAATFAFSFMTATG